MSKVDDFQKRVEVATGSSTQADLMAAAVLAAQSYKAELERIPEGEDDDGFEVTRAKRSLLVSLSRLADGDVTRVLTEHRGMECDGETTYQLVDISEVHAWRASYSRRPDAVVQAHDQDMPEGWTEASPGGMATNPDPQSGGIIDRTIATNEWFIVFNRDNLATIEGLVSRKVAFELFAVAIQNDDASLAVAVAQGQQPKPRM